jgi:hypothetical protein
MPASAVLLPPPFVWRVFEFHCNFRASVARLRPE